MPGTTAHMMPAKATQPSTTSSRVDDTSPKTCTSGYSGARKPGLYQGAALSRRTITARFTTANTAIVNPLASLAIFSMSRVAMATAISPPVNRIAATGVRNRSCTCDSTGGIKLFRAMAKGNRLAASTPALAIEAMVITPSTANARAGAAPNTRSARLCTGRRSFTSSSAGSRCTRLDTTRL